MIPIEEYEDAIRTRICLVCIDEASDGTCALTHHAELTCALQTMLPNVVQTIQTHPEASGEELTQYLRDWVCRDCYHGERDRCRLRDDVACALDRYFYLVVETVEGLRKRYFDDAKSREPQLTGPRAPGL